MERVTIEDVDPTGVTGGGERRTLTDPLRTANVALNHYRIDPGSGLPGGLHAHADQEEVFLVLHGTATFETLDGEVSVEACGAVRFAPGEYQSGRNDGGERLVVLALGAPRETEDTRVPIPCPDCGHDSLRIDVSERGVVFVCPDCAATHVPRDCPECGGETLEVTTDEAARPVVVCRDCDATFADPPLRT